MRKSLWTIALLFAVIGVPTVLRADITYSVDQVVGGGGVTGTITTDGTIGTLNPCDPGASCDIVNWNLILNNGSTTFDLFGPVGTGNSFPDVHGTDLTATATELLFNFSGGDNGYFFFEHSVGGIFFTYWCSETSTVCTGDPQGEGLAISSGGVHNQDFTALSGDQVIATVTPEPGTAILWLTGIALMILTRKRIAQLLRLDTERTAHCLTTEELPLPSA